MRRKLVKYLLHKHGDLSSVPRAHIKKPGVVGAKLFKSQCREGREERLPGAHSLASLANQFTLIRV